MASVCSVSPFSVSCKSPSLPFCFPVRQAPCVFTARPLPAGRMFASPRSVRRNLMHRVAASGGGAFGRCMPPRKGVCVLTTETSGRPPAPFRHGRTHWEVALGDPGSQAPDARSTRTQWTKGLFYPVLQRGLLPAPPPRPAQLQPWALSPVTTRDPAWPRLTPHHPPQALGTGWPGALFIKGKRIRNNLSTHQSISGLGSVSAPQRCFLFFDFSLNFWLPFLYFFLVTESFEKRHVSRCNSLCHLDQMPGLLGGRLIACALVCLWRGGYKSVIARFWGRLLPREGEFSGERGKPVPWASLEGRQWGVRSGWSDLCCKERHSSGSRREGSCQPRWPEVGLAPTRGLTPLFQKQEHGCQLGGRDMGERETHEHRNGLFPFLKMT